MKMLEWLATILMVAVMLLLMTGCSEVQQKQEESIEYHIHCYSGGFLIYDGFTRQEVMPGPGGSWYIQDEERGEVTVSADCKKERE